LAQRLSRNSASLSRIKSVTGVVVTALYGNDGDLPLEGFAEAEEGVAHAVETVSGGMPSGMVNFN